MGCEQYWVQFPESLLKPCPSRREPTHGLLPCGEGLGRLQHQGKAASLRVGPAQECWDGHLPQAPLPAPRHPSPLPALPSPKPSSTFSNPQMQKCCSRDKTASSELLMHTRKHTFNIQHLDRQ